MRGKGMALKAWLGEGNRGIMGKWKKLWGKERERVPFRITMGEKIGSCMRGDTKKG